MAHGCQSDYVSSNDVKDDIEILLKGAGGLVFILLFGVLLAWFAGYVVVMLLFSAL
jgi:hypothetical protein